MELVQFPMDSHLGLLMVFLNQLVKQDLKLVAVALLAEQAFH